MDRRDNWPTWAVVALIFWMVFSGCDSNIDRQVEPETKVVRVVYSDMTWDLSVIKVDNCEYVMSRTTRGVSIVHKENCSNHCETGKIAP